MSSNDELTKSDEVKFEDDSEDEGEEDSDDEFIFQRSSSPTSAYSAEVKEDYRILSEYDLCPKKEELEDIVLEHFSEISNRYASSIFLHLKNWNIGSIVSLKDEEKENPLDMFTTVYSLNEMLEEDDEDEETEGEFIEDDCCICLEKSQNLFGCPECDNQVCLYCIVAHIHNELESKKVVLRCFGKECEKILDYESLELICSHQEKKALSIMKSTTTTSSPSTKTKEEEEDQKLFQTFNLEYVDTKFKKNVMLSFIYKNPFLKPCPICKGEYYIQILGTNKPPQIGMDVRCRCQANFCYLCENRAHCLVPCTLFGRFLSLIINTRTIEGKDNVLSRTKSKLMKKIETNLKNFRWMEMNNVKRCPICKSGIQKVVGCKHIKCSNCDVDFCYDCGKSFLGNQKYDYRHHCSGKYFFVPDYKKIEKSSNSSPSSVSDPNNNNNNDNENEKQEDDDARKEKYLTLFLTMYYDLDDLSKKYYYYYKNSKDFGLFGKGDTGAFGEEEMKMSRNLNFNLLLKRTFYLLFHSRRVLMNSYVLKYYRFDRSKYFKNQQFFKDWFIEYDDDDEEKEKKEEDILKTLDEEDKKKVLEKDLKQIYESYQKRLDQYIKNIDSNLNKILQHHRNMFKEELDVKTFEGDHHDRQNNITQKIKQEQWELIIKSNKLILDFFKFVNTDIIRNHMLWQPKEKTFLTQIKPFIVTLEKDVEYNIRKKLKDEKMKRKYGYSIRNKNILAAIRRNRGSIMEDPKNYLNDVYFRDFGSIEKQIEYIESLQRKRSRANISNDDISEVATNIDNLISGSNNNNNNSTADNNTNNATEDEGGITLPPFEYTTDLGDNLIPFPKIGDTNNNNNNTGRVQKWGEDYMTDYETQRYIERMQENDSDLEKALRESQMSYEQEQKKKKLPDGVEEEEEEIGKPDQVLRGEVEEEEDTDSELERIYREYDSPSDSATIESLLSIQAFDNEMKKMKEQQSKVTKEEEEEETSSLPNKPNDDSSFFKQFVGKPSDWLPFGGTGDSFGGSRTDDITQNNQFPPQQPNQQIEEPEIFDFGFTPNEDGTGVEKDYEVENIVKDMNETIRFKREERERLQRLQFKGEKEKEDEDEEVQDRDRKEYNKTWYGYKYPLDQSSHHDFDPLTLSSQPPPPQQQEQQLYSPKEDYMSEEQIRQFLESQKKDEEDKQLQEVLKLSMMEK